MTGLLVAPESGFTVVKESSMRVVLAGLLVVGTGVLGADGGTASPQQGVINAMRANFGALMTLQSYAASAKRFADSANAEEIKHQLETLRQSRHALRAASKTREPGLKAMMELFDGYVATAQGRFEHGAVEPARRQLQTASGFCFGCHTRVVAPKDFEDLQAQVRSLDLAPLERADLLAATRQFAEALAAYREVMAAPVKGDASARAFGEAARGALRITVSARDDAKETQALLADLKGRSDLPKAVQLDVQGWQREVDAWLAEAPLTKDAGVEAQVARARALIGALEFPREGDAPDIALMRASRLLHQVLTKAPSGKHRPEALFLLGVAASGKPDPFLWELDRLYFESCVRESPHTEIARRCLKRLEGNVTQEFTGSAGTEIPPDLLQKIAELRPLAK